MLLPLILLVLAAVPAAVVAYGIDPAWAQYPHGIEFIVFSRRFEGPMIALDVILCVTLIGLVIAGKRRAWWLIGLAPIVVLIGHRFALNPNTAFLVNGRPNFVSADRASFMADDDWVVGLMDGPDAVAFPYASIYSRPLVLRSNQPQPMMLMWSPFANWATAERVDRSIRAEELEVVSMPANTLLVYNARVGQFINGITGQTMRGQKPAGFISTIPTIKTTWAQWFAAHPETIVLAPPAPSEAAPRRPVLPYFPMPKNATDLPPDARVAVIRGPSPAAVLDADLGAGPANFANPLVVLIRDPMTGSLAAFDRHVDEDLAPAFAARTFKKFPRAVMVDADSGSAWTADGRAVDGPLKGKKLQPLEVEDDVYYSVAELWFGDLPLLAPLPPPDVPDAHHADAEHATRHRRRN
ncbi:MAG TPA: DUF3179 domain-containing (seleno)protein [Tepidisphaeraceae bacterium]|nr:DUF3179 domain-containing (seleno)protein [Tepidisphaeraceae bacterium]